MAKDVADLARKCFSYGGAVARADQTSLTQIGVWGKGVMLGGGAAAGLRPGGALPSKSGGRGGRWGARFEDGSAGGLLRKAAWSSTTAITTGGQIGTTGAVRNDSRKSILLRYVGPVHWQFFGTQPHIITPKSGGGRKRRGRRAQGAAFLRALGQDASMTKGGGLLRTPYGPRPWVFHPGTTGKNTWPATKAQLTTGAPRMWVHAQKGALLSAFGKR
jgi:hypothetical protein